MQHIATLTGQQVNYNAISRDVGVDVRTVKEWLGVLESSCLIYFLQPYYDFSLTKRITKSPKLYFYDVGLACYLARISDAKTLEVSFLAGSFLETYVIGEIIKGFANSGTMKDLYYYRDSNQNEIDMVILENACLHLIEIKKSTKVDKAMVKAFGQLRDSQYKMGTSYLICFANKVVKVTDEVFSLPVCLI